MFNNMNHPSQLVHNHFHPDAFAVVQRVHSNLNLLRTLYDKLPLFDSLGSNYLSIEGISKYLVDIGNVSSNLNTLVQLSDSIPLLKDIAPRVEQFVELQQGIANKLDAHECNFREVLGLMESNTKHLEDLFVQYECSLRQVIEEAKLELCQFSLEQTKQSKKYLEQVQCMYEDFRISMITINKAVQEQNENKLLLEHLKTSDLVTTAVFTGIENDYEIALKQIKTSEKWGNNESINRRRLNYKLEDNNVLSILKSKQERLTKEKAND